VARFDKAAPGSWLRSLRPRNERLGRVPPVPSRTVWTDEGPPLPLDWAHNFRENEPDRPRISRNLLIAWSSM
jgi:hypothetical protein